MSNPSTLGRTRVAAIYIDCPRPGCGGGIESSDTGSFMLTVIDLADLEDGSPFKPCGTCLEPIRVPVAALALLRK